MSDGGGDFGEYNGLIFEAKFDMQGSSLDQGLGSISDQKNIEQNGTAE